MPAPAMPATNIYAPNCNSPVSNRGMKTAPAALFFVVVDELEDEDPVPVGAVVTVPVPADPAWLRRLEQLLLVVPDWILALLLKLQAVAALFWFL
jgi:hypothetical protein